MAGLSTPENQIYIALVLQLLDTLPCRVHTQNGAQSSTRVRQCLVALSVENCLSHPKVALCQKNTKKQKTI